jgi:hypothetical protein
MLVEGQAGPDRDEAPPDGMTRSIQPGAMDRPPHGGLGFEAAYRDIAIE